jgi:hypothetical protein
MVNCTDDGNTIGCVAERKDPGRVGYNFAARAYLLWGVFLPKARIHLDEIRLRSAVKRDNGAAGDYYRYG